ncbi:dihydrodipicolinate synthase family protein [Bordetella bronchiseptica]|uniref:dihydrodipicolinate synthase family protein n=1 Tax=Bordetella bronchiseptica TaxID=518 RepID=UPI00045AB874|nr:dihydrodipicolinate synthase family protein [Bordetella bronchiseptica]KAK50814.1 dihydrodipicolinate synthetase family protein [Bordetella bronchiseptica OSU054]KDB76215.1 dihydrodipicolinate synthetase family protein [Bordetella bronchiseptica CA90 BB1334]KDC66998.1 dihydrodipicolinate synthetase family protein [Bordetella bronchiseptica MBORD591]KDD46854.1 dihydrodipicolinate synthetase family protein [Bordetella bronchiseptica OSU095]KDD95270.1 dihydrodipicolinate synthetase family prot
MQASHGARIDEQTSGVYVIAATPFADDGELDLASLDSLTDFYLDKDVAGLTILGMMGEASKLTEAETATVMTRILKRVDGRVPVVVGVSHPSNRHLERLARQAMALGAAGVMVAPAAGRHTDDQVYGYYATVAERLGADIPICLQDFPQSTGVHTSVAVIHRLVDDFPQVVMLKHEDFPGMRKLSQVRARSEAEGRRRISILVGNGGLFLPQEMLRGADGAMTGFAYPEMLVQVCRLFAAGKAEAAEDLFNLYLPLLRHEFQYGIGLALRKETLRRRGAIRSAYVRQPGPALDAVDHAELGRLIARLEAQLGRAA